VQKVPLTYEGLDLPGLDTPRGTNQVSSVSRRSAEALPTIASSRSTETTNRRALTWMTFLFLMAIAFLPFPTLLLGEYRDQQISVIFYAADAAVASLLLVGISWYARSGHRLVPEDIDEEQARLRTAQGLAVPVVFLVSIIISIWSPEIALYSWLLLVVSDPLVGWAWRRARRSSS